MYRAPSSSDYLKFFRKMFPLKHTYKDLFCLHMNPVQIILSSISPTIFLNDINIKQVLYKKYGGVLKIQTEAMC